MTGSAVGHDRIKHAFLWPAFLIVLVISLFPLIYALTVSFQTVRVVPPTPPRFVGFDELRRDRDSPRASGARSGPRRSIAFLSVGAPIRDRLRAGAGAAPQRAGVVALPRVVPAADVPRPGGRRADRADGVPPLPRAGERPDERARLRQRALPNRASGPRSWCWSSSRSGNGRPSSRS